MLHHIENHIGNMRQKPEHIKRRYAFVISLTFVIIIFSFWVGAHTLSLNPEAAAIAKSNTSPVQALTANASDAFKYVKETVFGANKAKYSSDNVEVVGGKN